MIAVVLDINTVLIKDGERAVTYKVPKEKVSEFIKLAEEKQFCWHCQGTDIGCHQCSGEGIPPYWAKKIADERLTYTEVARRQFKDAHSGIQTYEWSEGFDYAFQNMLRLLQEADKEMGR